MLFKKFTIETWGESAAEVENYLKYNTSNVRIKSINKASGNKYIIKGKITLRDRIKLLQLMDIDFI